jgi:hypothetical protein
MKTLSARGPGILSAALALASSACAYGLGSADDAVRLSSPDHAVQIHVTNHSGSPMEIHAVGSGTFYGVGTVHPGLTRWFEVRPGMTVNGPVEFVAQAAGVPTVRSGPILLRPGDVVDFDLGTHHVNSTAVVRPRLRG